MNKNDIDMALYSIPKGVDYTDLSDELDLEDIPPERIEKVKKLLNNDDKYIVFQSARLLTSWGVKEGFEALKNLLEGGQLNGLIDHRLHGYDDTYKHVLGAFINYWAQRSDENKGEEARKAIFEPVSIIIQASNTQFFQINHLFRLVSNNDFDEYIPLLKEHFRAILEAPENNYWRIHDVMEFFLKVQPEFVAQVLEDNSKELSDFGF